MALPRTGYALCVLWGWIAFLVIGSVGALANLTPFNQYIRIIYPFWLFLEGFLVAWWLAKDSRGASTIVSSMVTAAVASMIFTVWWGFHFTGESLDEIRYQILSPVLPLLTVIAGYDLIFAARRRLWSLVMLLAAVALIALSVTRGMLVVVLVVVTIVLMAALFNALQTGAIPRPIQRAAFWGAIAGSLGIFAAALIFPDLGERWVSRVFMEGDLTVLIRTAAVMGQFNELSAAPLNWLIGLGFGSSHEVPIWHFPSILSHVGLEVSTSTWSIGEFMWMPFLFYAGGGAGLAAPIALLWGGAHGFRILATLLSRQAWRIPQSRPLWVGVLGFYAILGTGFSSNPFAFRLSALFLGLCLGLFVRYRRPVLSLLDERRGSTSRLSFRAE